MISITSSPTIHASNLIHRHHQLGGGEFASKATHQIRGGDALHGSCSGSRLDVCRPGEEDEDDDDGGGDDDGVGIGTVHANDGSGGADDD